MLGVRLEPELEAQLAAVAHAYGRTKSDIAREAVRRYIKDHDEAYRAECRRQSLVVAALPRTADDDFWDDGGFDLWGAEDDTSGVGSAPEVAPR
nr:CopG family transcriptional regulator [Polymorphobacter sp.]